MAEEKVKKPLYKRWWVWVVALVVIIALSTSGESENEPTNVSDQPAVATSNDVNENQQQEPEVTDNYIKAGMYKVGADLAAGEYLIIPEGMGYYQVTKDSSGSFEGIITNDNFAGTRYVTVSEGQYLEIKNSKMIPASEAEAQQPKDNVYLEGMYKAGKDITPGEYKAVSTGGMAYLEVSKDSNGGLESIISNDNFDGEKYITVSEGQYIKLNGCELIR